MLWISYVFPPFGGKHGQQGAYEIRELAKRGVEVDVLTVCPHPQFPDMDPSLLAVVPPSAAVHRTRPGLLSRFRYGRASRAAAFLSNIEWIPIGWRALRGLAGGYDGIYSLGDPISCHVVAALAKRHFGGRLFLDYGDPYALKPPRRDVSAVRLRAQRALEAWCLRHADAIGMRVDANANAYREIFPFLANTQFVTIYGGVDQQAFDKQTTNVSQHDYFNIIYTGKVYNHTVGVVPLLVALSRLQDRGDRIGLTFVGANERELRNIVPEQLLQRADFSPYTSMDQIMRVQKSAELLVALGFNYPYAIPSKISEYIAARRPVMCVEEKANRISNLVLDYRRGVSVPPDAEEITRELEGLYRSWESGLLEASFDLATDVYEISWPGIVDRILCALT